jgi:hypothetical protein
MAGNILCKSEFLTCTCGIRVVCVIQDSVITSFEVKKYLIACKEITNECIFLAYVSASLCNGIAIYLPFCVIMY